MGKHTSPGFTIIEVTLFVAISGLLAVLLLAGWTTMINNQRYQDSVTTVYSYVQQQYNLVYNVENGRDESLTCSNSEVTDASGPNTTARGQSSCVLLGRYLVLRDGVMFSSYPVVGTEPAAPLAATLGSKEVFDAYAPKPAVQSIGLSETGLEVPWQAVIRGAGTPSARATAQNTGFLIVRSPTTGTVHTYIFDPGVDDATLPASSEWEEDRTVLCLDPGIFVSGQRQAVVLQANASSQSSVETLGSDNGC